MANAVMHTGRSNGGRGENYDYAFKVSGEIRPVRFTHTRICPFKLWGCVGVDGSFGNCVIAASEAIATLKCEIQRPLETTDFSFLFGHVCFINLPTSNHSTKIASGALVITIAE